MPLYAAGAVTELEINDIESHIKKKHANLDGKETFLTQASKNLQHYTQPLLDR
jgi:hypothetical protein